MTIAKLVDDLAWLLNSGDFWVSFWSGVASLLLGIPTGVWLARGAERRQHRKERDEDQARLGSALEVVGSTIASNRAAIDGVLKALSEDKNPLVLVVNVDVWYLLQNEIAPLLRDPRLQADLGWHFTHLRFCLELHGRFIEHVLRPQYGTDQRKAMVVTLSNMLTQVRGHIDQLEPRVQTATASANTPAQSKLSRAASRMRAFFVEGREGAAR
jgi:hypothetical protein